MYLKRPCQSRIKREDDCLDCNTEWRESDDVIQYTKRKEECQNKNIVVCKSCDAHDLFGVTLHTTRWSFEVWCFDSGSVANRVILQISTGLHLQSIDRPWTAITIKKRSTCAPHLGQL